MKKRNLPVINRWSNKPSHSDFETLDDRLKALKYDPVAKMVEIANSSLDERVRLYAASKIFDAVIKMQLNRHSEGDSTQIMFNIHALADLVKSKPTPVNGSKVGSIGQQLQQLGSKSKN